MIFLESSLDLLPEAEPFDVVLSNDTFERVQDLHGLLEGLAKRPRSGGALVFGFSHLYYSPNGDHGRYGLPRPADVGLNCLTRREFESMLPSCQWERVHLRINPISTALRIPFDLFRRILSLERFFTVGLYGIYRKRG